MERIKRLTTTLLVVALLANSAAAYSPRHGTNQSARATKVNAQEPAREQNATDKGATAPNIDGAKNPELISDQVAYRLFFRFLSGRHTEEEKRRGVAYVRQVLGACRACSDEQQARKALAVPKKDIDALLAAADDYARKVSLIDDEAKKIRERAGGRDIQPEVDFLKQQRNAVAREVTASLPGRLDAGAAAAVQQYVVEEFKRKVKINRLKKPRKAGAQKVGFVRASFATAAQSEPSSDVVNYSDSWFVDNTGAIFNAEDESLDLPETMGTGETVGAGVTEADYDSEVVSVTTTLTRADGTASTVTQFTSASYTRAETALVVNFPEFPEGSTADREEQWSVNTSHRYRVYAGDTYDDPYDRPMMEAPVMAFAPGLADGRLFRKASYTAVRPAYFYWYYYTTYSYFTPIMTFFLQAMDSPIKVTRWYYGRYMTVCEYQRKTCDARCGYKVVRAAPRWGPNLQDCGPYLQTGGIRFRYVAPPGLVIAGGCVILTMRHQSVPGTCTSP